MQQSGLCLADRVDCDSPLAAQQAADRHFHATPRPTYASIAWLVAPVLRLTCDAIGIISSTVEAEGSIASSATNCLLPVVYDDPAIADVCVLYYYDCRHRFELSYAGTAGSDDEQVVSQQRQGGLGAWDLSC